MSRRVFVVQNQHRWDAGLQRFVPKFDLTPAEEFGDLVYLLSPTAAPFRPDSVIEELTQKLEEYRPDDYLLLVGNPVLIGISVAIAARASGGSVSMLQWSGKERRYLPVKTSLFTSNGGAL